MAFISLQGTSLTRSQRERLEQQRKVKASFINPILAQQVEETLAAVDQLKLDGVKPVKLATTERREKGTVSIAEWMGF